MNKYGLLMILLTPILSSCIHKSNEVCPSIPLTFITPAPYDSLEGNYADIPTICIKYANDAISCKFNRFQDSESMKAARDIDNKVRK